MDKRAAIKVMVKPRNGFPSVWVSMSVSRRKFLKTAGAIVKWLKDDVGLGHGHAMAIYALLKGLKREDSP